MDKNVLTNYVENKAYKTNKLIDDVAYGILGFKGEKPRLSGF